MNRRPDEANPDRLVSWLRGCAAVAEILPSARDLPEAAPDVLRTLAVTVGWDAAALWLPNPAGDAMRCATVWSRSDLPLAVLESDLLERRTPRGRDAVGQAWVERWVTPIEDVVEVSPDAAATRERAKVRGVLAIPVLYGDLVHGVIELFRVDPLALDESSRTAAGLLGRQIGQFAAREDAMRALQRTKRDLADLFENAPVGLHVTGADGTVVRVNRTGLAVLGAVRDEVVGRPWRDLFEDPTAFEEFWGRLKATRATGESLSFDARMRTGESPVRWIRTNANVSWSEDGRLLHVRGFFRDVTAFKEAEEALRRSEDRYRRLVVGARDYALHSLDESGKVTSWNAGSQRLYGWPEPDILGRDFGVSFTPEDRSDEVPPRMLRLAADEGEFHHEGWRVRADGSRFWAEVVYTALRDATGRLVEFSQLTRDASQRRRLEALRQKSADLAIANREVIQAAHRRSELLQRILAAVDRPLQEVEAAARRLREGATHAATPVEGLPVLLTGVEELARSIRGLEDLAEDGTDGLDLQPEAIDLVRTATETRDLLRDLAAQRQVRVQVDVDPGLSDVVTDDARLRQVLYNLLSNAIKFSRERGLVRFRILPEGEDYFRVEVEDAGIGLSDEEAASILQRDDAEGLEEGGGLGLAATRRIVEQQGGRLGVHSTPGRGSLFFVVMPRSLLQQREEAAEENGPSPRGERVLVVSEDPATRANLCWTLGNTGYEVVSAVDAAEALDISRERRCDVIAVDLLLQGMGPVDFVTTLRSEGSSRDARHVLLALGSRETGVAGILGTDLLPRPVPADRLFAALERARVPRGRARPVLVVDADPGHCKSVARSLDLLNYRAVPEVDGHAALKACAEELPSAVLLSPFLRGLDVFSFLQHLRHVRGAKDVPVLLMLPRQFEPRELEEIEQAAAEAAQQGTWYRQITRGTRSYAPAASDTSPRDTGEDEPRAS